MDDCIFCRIVSGKMPSFKVYEDDKVLAFEDINPISEGHTLVIPKRHAQDLWEISRTDLTAVHLAAKKVVQAIKDALHPTGVACLQLNGRGVNQMVMHYHLHLIPRSPGNPQLPVSDWKLKKGDKAAIRQTAEKISAEIK